GRSARRALQVARSDEPDQHRAGDRRCAQAARGAGGRGATSWPLGRGRRPGAAPAGTGRGSRRGTRGEGGCLMQIKVTQTRSEIGGSQTQRATLRGLGLKRIGDTVVKEDRPEIRGMIRTVTHLVTFEEVD